MFQPLAFPQAGCRRLTPRHLQHKLTTLAAIAVAAFISQAIYIQPLKAETNTRPNIILIMADDMGYSDAGCFGGEVHTPHIDALAKSGLRFTQFYNNAICGPTRASLLTGLYCQQTGHSGRNWNQAKNFNKCATVGELLQHAGYHTMMVGKWQGRDLAVKRGFHRFFGPNCQAKISYYDEVVKNHYSLNDKPWKVPDEDFFMTDALSDYAVEFLKETTTQKKPFFLYTAYIAPHWPLHTREQDIAPYRDQYLKQGWDQHRAARFKRQQQMGLIPDTWKLSPKPKNIHDWKDDRFKNWQAERMAAYAGQITCMDRGIGKILNTLKDIGAEDNTLVMFLSDNGAAPNGGLVPTKKYFSGDLAKNWRIDGGKILPGSGPKLMPGPHNTFAAYGHAWANLSNTPLNNFKSSAYEGGIRTPLVVRWPKVIQKGNQITNQPGHVIDFMATCLDVAGATYPRQFQNRNLTPMEGKSLVPILHGHQRQPHKTLCWNTFGNAIRAGNWKLVMPVKSKSWELYNLKTDGTETNNLANSMPEKVAELSKRYQEWQKKTRK